MIIDDHSFFRTSLESSLQPKIDEGTIFEQAASVAEGLKMIPQFQPDVLLLDLNMKDGTGIDLLLQLEVFDFDVICMSSYDTHDPVVKRLQQAGFGFFEKKADLKILTELIRKGQVAQTKKYTHKRIEVLRELYKAPSEERVVEIAIHLSGQLQFAPLDSIIRFEADHEANGPITIFCLKQDETYISDKPFSYYETILRRQGFMNCNSSLMVNTSAIVRVQEKTELILTDGSKVEANWRKVEKEPKPSGLLGWFKRFK